MRSPKLRRVTLDDGTPFWCLRPGEVRVIQESVADYFRHGIAVKDGNVVFDVGANIGLFAQAVRRLGARDLSVYSFEPIPDVYAALAANARECRDTRWIALPCGLGRRRETVTFRYHFRASFFSTAYSHSSPEERQRWRETLLADPSRFPWNVRWITHLPRLVRDPLLDAGIRKVLKGRKVACELRTVSDVIREHRLPRIDLLKIDVEKAEADVLAGVADDDWPRIRQVVVEVHDLHDRLAAVTALLRRHGFDVAVDQESILRHTDIYNVYAVRRQSWSQAGGDARSSASTSTAPVGRPAA
jgi:FkbM family methyltransferase